MVGCSPAKPCPRNHQRRLHSQCPQTPDTSPRHVALNNLTPLDIQFLYSKLLRRGLAPRTVRYVHATLRRALSMAVRSRVLNTNPALGLSLPKLDLKPMQVLDEAQPVKLLDEVKGTMLEVPVTLALLCGMRRGEIVGLTWEQVDLDRGMLYVTQTLQRQKGLGLVVQQTKTYRGRRPIELSPRVSAKTWRKTQAANLLRQGVGRQKQDWVCTYPSGKPWDPNDLTRSFRKLVDDLGLPHVRFHDLRHTHATHLLRAGANPKVVQERLGHASAGFTLNVYAQVMPGIQREAAEAVERLLSSGERS